MILANDLAIPFAIVLWYLTHYVWDMHAVLMMKPVRVLWTFFGTVFRVHSACNTSAAAASTLTPGAYYPIPLIGPVIAGTLVGSLGAFLPFDKGLAPISSGTPWPIQQAFLTSLFFHFLVTDKAGFVGTGANQISIADFQ